MTAAIIERPPTGSTTKVGPGEDWYVESTALVKLVLQEPGSTAMSRWIEELLDAGGRPFTSDLGRTEAYRAVVRHDAPSAQNARQVHDAFLRVRIEPETFRLAMELGPPMLRTLDALHLAVVLGLDGRAAGIVTYDRRIVEAAAAVGIRAVSP
jgi:predicted nucleic acid-binding protein